jgi:hypothetical protein
MEQTPVDLQVHRLWYDVEMDCRHQMLSTAYMERELQVSRIIVIEHDWAIPISHEMDMIRSSLWEDVK